MKLKLLIIIVLLIAQFNLVSQKKVELVFKDNKNMTISDVNALINKRYYTSDREGKIFIVDNEDTLSIKATYLGYNTLDTTVNIIYNNYFLFELTFQNELPTVEIKSKQLINRSISKNIITASDIKRTFPLLGEKDPMKTLQMMPGVIFAQEGTASIYVRGGNPGENLILLDNVPLYNANHFFGLVSAINPDVISSLEFYKGGFPAQYNDRVSSIIDIKTKDGDVDNVLKIGLLSSSITLKKKLLKERLSFTASVRSSPISALVYGFNEIIESNSSSGELFNTYFYDLYSKVNYNFSNKTNVYISYFNSYDELLIKNFNDRGPSRDSTRLNWSNSMINAGINSYFGFGLKNESNVYISNYFLKNIDRYNLRNGELLRKYDYLNNIEDFGVKTRFTLPVNFQTKIRVGGNFQRQFFTNRSNSNTSLFSILREESIKKFYFKQDVLNAYLSFDGFLLGDKIKYDFGINHMSNLTTGKNFIEPRINSSINLNHFSFLYSFHRLGQNTSLITPEAIGIPFQIWLPSQDKNNLIQSRQHSLGTIYRKNNFEFSLEAYAKKVINLNYPSQGQDIRIIDPFSSEVLKGGTQTSKGIEFFIKGFTLKNTIQFSYTLSRSLLFFEGYNKNKPFRQNIDRLHNANLTFEHMLNKKWSFNTVFVYHSSYPITIPEVIIPAISYFTFANKSKFTFPELFLVDFKGNGVNSSLLWDTESVNNGRSRDYLRMDFNAKKTIRKNDKIKAEISFGIYNLTFRKNPFVSSITDNIDGDTQNKLLLSTFSLFNFIPFISYEKYF